MVRVSSPAKLRPWSELIAKMVMGVVPGLVTVVDLLHIVIHYSKILEISTECSDSLQFPVVNH